MTLHIDPKRLHISPTRACLGDCQPLGSKQHLLTGPFCQTLGPSKPCKPLPLQNLQNNKTNNDKRCIQTRSWHRPGEWYVYVCIHHLALWFFYQVTRLSRISATKRLATTFCEGLGFTMVHPTRYDRYVQSGTENSWAFPVKSFGRSCFQGPCEN